MKIGFLNVLYSKRAARGGLGEHIADLSCELSRRGHDVTVLTSGPRGTSVEDGVTVIRLGRVDRFVRPSQLLTPTYPLRRLFYMARAARCIRAHRFDVVEAAEAGFEHLFALGRRPCPIVIKLHGDFRHIHSRAQPLAAVMHALEGLALRWSDGMYASSGAYARTVAADYDISPDRIRVIPYGITLDGSGHPRLADRHPRLAGKRVVLLSVGASPGRKGAPVFIEAARRVSDPDTLFVLVCSSPAAVRPAAPPANLLVLAHLPRPDFHALLALAEVVVLPSEFESLSIATYEAMLLGRPVILSSHIPLEGPALEYPRRVTLARIEAGALAEAVQRVLGGAASLPAVDPTLLAQLRHTYGIGTVAADTLAFYRDIVQRYRRQRSRV